MPARCSRSPSDDQYPWCAAPRARRSSQLQGGGKIGPCPSKTANPSDAARSGLGTATAALGTGRRARGGRLPGAVQHVPHAGGIHPCRSRSSEVDRQRRPREERAGHDHEHHDRRCGPRPPRQDETTWRRSRRATSPPTSSTTSRGAMRSTASSRTRTGFILQMVLFVALFGGLYYFLFRRIGGGASSALNLGRNKVKIYDRKEMKTSFTDVAGVDEAKEELRDRRLPEEPEEVPATRRPDPQGRPVARSPAAGRRCSPGRSPVRRTSRSSSCRGRSSSRCSSGARRRSRPRAVPAGEGEGAALVFLDEIDTIGKGAPAR